MFVNCCLKSTIFRIVESTSQNVNSPPLHQLQILCETLTRCFDCYYNCVSWFSYHLLYSMALQPSSRAVEEQSLGSVQRRSRRLAVLNQLLVGVLQACYCCVSVVFNSLCVRNHHAEGGYREPDTASWMPILISTQLYICCEGVGVNYFG